MKISLTFILIMNLALADCSAHRKNADSSLKKGMLLDLRGLDGCSWALQTEGGERLIPLNIDDFNIEKKDSLPVSFSFNYHETMNVCMAGKTVQLTELRKN